ncbi:MAG: hypothetical protein WCT52_01275 [Candidatus Micrarchaeia archaeon]
MMKITLDRGSYRAGETVNASVELKLDKPVKARALVVEFACFERKKVKVTRELDEYDYARRRELGLVYTSNVTTEVVEEGARRFHQQKEFSGGEFSGGVYDVGFTLPPDAPPTSKEFGHDNKTFVWKISAKLDIPLALDVNTETEVFVEGL